MEFGRVDSNLRSETELISVIEPGGGIDQDHGGVHLLQEPLSPVIVVCDDRFRVVGTVGLDVVQRLVQIAVALVKPGQLEARGEVFGVQFQQLLERRERITSATTTPPPFRARAR